MVTLITLFIHFLITPILLYSLYKFNVTQYTHNYVLGINKRSVDSYGLRITYPIFCHYVMSTVYHNICVNVEYLLVILLYNLNFCSIHQQSHHGDNEAIKLSQLAKLYQYKWYVFTKVPHHRKIWGITIDIHC